MSLNLQFLIATLSALVSDYASFEAGTAVTSPSFDLDLTALGIGKAIVTVTAKKSV